MDVMHLLENVPFSDPSVLKPSYQCFGRHVYEQLLLCDKKGQEHSVSRYDHVHSHTHLYRQAAKDVHINIHHTWHVYQERGVTRE